MASYSKVVVESGHFEKMEAERFLRCFSQTEFCNLKHVFDVIGL